MFQCVEVLDILNKCCDRLSRDSHFTQDDMSVLSLAGEKLGGRLFSGATKAVIVLEDMAIKIPFNGYYDSFGFQEFTCARDQGTGWDYCAAELDVLRSAAVEGLEMCFAQEEFVGTIGGYPVYAQERCVIWDHIHDYQDYTKEKRDSTEKYVSSKGYYCFNECWLSDFLDYYGSEMLEKFLDFVETNEIMDLHGGNLGYVGNRPVIVDYGDYHEGSEECYDSWGW